MLDKIVFEGKTVYGKNLDRIFVHGQGPDIFLAIGCSWTRAWGADNSCKPFGSKDYKDDHNFILNRSYVGLLARHLGFDSIINLAIPGSSIDMQVRFLVEFLQKNRKQFRRIFVLWGLTSHLRWELYSNKIDKPVAFQIGADVPVVAASFYPGRDIEMRSFLVNHWNEAFELERYNHKIVMTHAYLSMLDIDHLFFCTFESFDHTNMNLEQIPDDKYFLKNCHPADMLSLWCKENDIPRPWPVYSAPFSEQDISVQQDLIDLGFLSQNYAHPTEKAHSDIAHRLIKHLT